MLIIIALPLNVPRTLPSSLVATESHNFAEMSAATFLAVKQGARRNKQKLNMHIYISKIGCQSFDNPETINITFLIYV